MHPLITPDALAELLAGDHPPVVLDVRWRLAGPPARDDYDRDHIPGAVFLDLDADLSATPGPLGRHPLPSAGHLEQVLRAAGVRAGQPVVAYDAGDGSVAARLWWLLRWAGHSEVAVLDGGYSAWQAGGHSVTDAVPEPAPGDITITPGHLPVLDAEQAGKWAREALLLDARAPERYRGEVEPIDPAAGHVPGAVNAPFSGHVGPDGRWLAPAELAARFRGLGVTDGVPVGAYCGSGVTASSIVLALEVAGLTTAAAPAALYAGSWSNWSADPSRPVATGEQPG